MLPVFRNIWFLTFLFFALQVTAKPSIDDFIREADYRTAKISPDGRYLAEVWNSDTSKSRIVTIKDLSTSDQKTIGMLADSIVRPYDISWANNERLLVSLSVPYKTESVIRESQEKDDFDIYDYFLFSRTLAMNVDGSNKVVLMDDERGVRRNVNLSRIRHFLPNDKEHVLMIARKGRFSSLFKVNVYTGESELVTRGTRFTYAFLNDAEGNLLYRLDYKRIAKRIDIYAYQEEKWIRVDKIELDQNEEDEEQGEIDRGELIGLYGDDLVYRKRNEETGYKELWKYHRETKKFNSMVALPHADILGTVTSARTFDIIGYVKDGDIRRRVFFNREHQKQYDILVERVGDYGFHETSWTTDGELSIVKTYGSDNPGAYWLYRQSTNEMTLLNHGYFGIAMQNLSLPASVKFQSRDGLVIHSYILFPQTYESGKKYPLIVYPHGGPTARDRQDYDDFAQFMSTRGYIVIRPNFRGSIGYGKAFEEAGYKQWGLAMQDDLEDAVKFMERKNYIDNNKVCLVGASYGGYAALMGAIKTPKLYRCSISINGPTNLVDLVNEAKKRLGDKDLTKKYVYDRVGHPKLDKVQLEENSPALQAGRVGIPVMIIAGVKDERVPYKHAKKMVKNLKKNKKAYELIRLEDAGHNPFYYRDDREKVYTKVEEFLEKHLQ